MELLESELKYLQVRMDCTSTVTPADHGVNRGLVERLLFKYTDCTSCSLISYRYQSSSDCGRGLTSLRYILQVTYTAEKGTLHECNFFIKVPITTRYNVRPDADSCMKNYLGNHLNELFRREAIFYESVVGNYYKKAEATKKSIQLPFPRFYFCRINAETKKGCCQQPQETPLLVLEYLEEFKADQDDAKDLSHLQLICSCLGELHALGAFVTECLPELVDSLVINWQAMPGELSDAFARKQLQPLHAFLKFRRQDKLAERLENLCTSNHFLEDFRRATNPRSQHTCLLHTDIWSGNFLFRYDPQSLQPTDVRVVDFQLVCLGSAGFDLATLQVMWPQFSRHRHQLLNVYAKSFQQQLSGLMLQEYSSAGGKHRETCRTNGIQRQRPHMSSAPPAPTCSSLISLIERDYFCSLVYWCYKGSPLAEMICNDSVCLHNLSNKEDNIGSKEELLQSLQQHGCGSELSTFFGHIIEGLAASGLLFANNLSLSDEAI